MALRCLTRLKNLNQLIIRTSPVAAVAQHESSFIARTRNENSICAVNNIQIRHFAYKKKQSSYKEDEEEPEKEEEFDGDEFEKKQTVKVTVQSLRADLLLKSGIGMARNKIEAAFYENKIRINGKKITKKSVSCSVGDEIDLIRNDSPTNPNHQVVARIEILSTTPREDSIVVTMKRFKTLTVEKKED